MSYNGGSTWETAFDWNGSALVSQNATKYAMKANQAGDGYVWFYANIDTTLLGTSQVVKVRVYDNNNPTPYFSESSIQLSFDNTAPTGSFVAWGTSDPSNKQNFSIANGYFGGNADDTQSGIRYARLFIWDNQGSAQSPNYGGGGTISANVASGTFMVSIPTDFSTILPTGGTDTAPDYLIQATMYTPQNWRILSIYSEINQKYAQYPVDGKKLIGLEVTDNAGNTTYSFTELEFSEYPPTIVNAQGWWGAMTSGEKIELPGETVSDRIWISGSLKMTGTVNDSKAGDPAPGIDRIRVLIKSDDGVTTYATYSTESDGSVEITPAPALPTSNSSNVTFTLAAQNTALINGGQDNNYLMVLEVRDKVGVTTTKKQYVFIDNTLPVLTVTQPTNALAVTGDFNIYGTVSDLGGFASNSIKIEIMYLGSPTASTWTTTPSSGNWNKWWDTSSPANFDAVRITATDKAMNQSIVTRSISKDPTPPSFSSFTANASALDTDYSAFTALYPEFTTTRVYFTKGATTTFTNTITDNDAFSGAGIYVTGTRQSGLPHSELYQTMNPASDAAAPYNVGEVGSYVYNALPDGEYTYRAQVYQQSGAVEVNLRKHFIVDNTKPHIWMLDMQNYDFVGYGTSTSYGHIDTGLNSNGSATGYDDVSGVVTLYIKAFDNYLLNTIQARLTTYDFGSGSGSWHTLLSRSASGTWNTPASRGVLGDVNYFKVTILGQEMIADRDYVYLKLDINTAGITNVAGLDKLFELRDFDMAGNESVAGDASVSSEVPIAGEPNPSALTPNASYQKWVRKGLDIVPYIKSIVRSVGASNTMRTKYGKFIVREGETNLTVNGYNLAETGTSWFRIYNTADSLYDEVTTANYVANANYTALGSVNLATITHSGWLKVSVNGIIATNNVNNNNNLDNTNKESSLYIAGSDLWTDDRYLHVWKTGSSFSSSNAPVHPAMSKHPSNDNLYASWSYYAGADVNYAQLGSAMNNIRSSYDPPEWTDIAVDTSGNVHVAYLQNEYNNVSSWGYLVTYVSGTGTANIEHLGDDDISGGGSGNQGDGMDEQLYQFQNPRITLNGTTNYVSYYDAYSKTLKYAVTNGTTATFTAENGHRTDSATVVDGIEDTTAPPTSTGDDVGLWSDIIVDKIGGTDTTTVRPVIIYNDTTNSTLKIARGNNSQPNGTAEWTINSVFRSDDPNKDYAGNQVSLAIDSNGDLHAVCYKIDTGDLLYLHAPNIDGTGTYTFDYSVVVDSVGAVGSWPEIFMVGTTPYISYLNNGMIGSFYGLKYAYYDTAKADWEYGIAASNTVVLDKRTSLAAKATGVAAWGGTKGKIAIAYGSGTFDVIFLEDEE
jgi:hypothetical protein